MEKRHKHSGQYTRTVRCAPQQHSVSVFVTDITSRMIPHTETRRLCWWYYVLQYKEVIYQELYILNNNTKIISSDKENLNSDSITGEGIWNRDSREETDREGERRRNVAAIRILPTTPCYLTWKFNLWSNINTENES